MTHAEYLKFLMDNGYTDIKLIGENKWAAILRYMFTHAIILGNIGDIYGFSDRWCYYTHKDAQNSLDAWDGIGEPDGWHRHPDSGRRRPDGDRSQEYINL